MSGSAPDAVVKLGQAGRVARARVIAGAGIAALDAAVTCDAAEAKGAGGVLRSFAQSPSGLIASGILSSAEVRWPCTPAESLPEQGVQLASAGRVSPPAAIMARPARLIRGGPLKAL